MRCTHSMGVGCRALLGFGGASVSCVDCIYKVLLYVVKPLSLGSPLQVVWHIQVSRVHQVANCCISGTCSQIHASLRMAKRLT